MTKELDIVDLVRRAAREVTGRELPGLTLDSHLATTGIDSVGVLEMAVWIEDEIGLRLPDEEIARLATVGDVKSLIERIRRAGEGE